MKIKVVLDKGAKLPTRGHADDAGLDIYTPEMLIIKPRKAVTVDTGVHIQIPKGYVGFLKSKSGLNVKQSLLSEGVIDCGYTGSIRVKLYNHGEVAAIINSGEKISQLVLLPIITPDLEVVEALEETERAEYIEREALIKRLEVTPILKPHFEFGEYIRKGIIDLVKRQPAADVVEVRHGEWADSGEGDFRCTNCNDYFTLDIDMHPIDDCGMNYCPNCGAKMDGKEGG